MPRRAKTERNNKMMEMYRNGISKSEIARSFGVSHSAVYQVLKKCRDIPKT